VAEGRFTFFSLPFQAGRTAAAPLECGRGLAGGGTPPQEPVWHVLPNHRSPLHEAFPYYRRLYGTAPQLSSRCSLGFGAVLQCALLLFFGMRGTRSDTVSLKDSIASSCDRFSARVQVDNLRSFPPNCEAMPKHAPPLIAIRRKRMFPLPCLPSPAARGYLPFPPPVERFSPKSISIERPSLFRVELLKPPYSMLKQIYSLFHRELPLSFSGPLLHSLVTRNVSILFGSPSIIYARRKGDFSFPFRVAWRRSPLCLIFPSFQN